MKKIALYILGIYISISFYGILRPEFSPIISIFVIGCVGYMFYKRRN